MIRLKFRRGARNSCSYIFCGQTITINQGTLDTEAEISTGMHDNRQNCFRFQFHHVLHNAGQDAIYDGLARDVVQGAVDGISGKDYAIGCARMCLVDR